MERILPIDDSGAGQGSLRSYLTGFILSVLLSLIAFGTVMTGRVSAPAASAIVIFAAVVQVLVHLRFFLHLNASSAWRWNVLALIFTGVIMFLFVGGTLWIMFHLNQRLM